ncbi:hypothetical protein [Budvicia aquatica]|uniref:DUF2184 domain-containing protein n=1 Tax=Budvicia aquatica TaxID=82979 RepID=A0A2C6DPM0_9GAMM|nr:hypothetical protein [Budvicia aquatica]PHI31167.1 hypothetical protein CRN84_18390 [Budvicia aquatica]VFS51423.1 Uncharacterised protein [Budvicia aquatica]
MSGFAPAITVIQPSMMLPQIAMQYSMATGAFELLADGAPSVKIGSSDLAVYQKYLRVTTNTQAGQSLPGELPSSSVVPSYDQMMTYRISTRSQYNVFDSEAAGNWGYSLTEALRLAARQGMAQQLRNMLLYGINATNNEGLVHSPNAVTANLGSDSGANTTYQTWDSGELAQYMLNTVGSLKTKMFLLGQPVRIVILAPQRFLQQITYAGVVQLTNFQRVGAGTATAAEMVKAIAAGAGGDEIIFCADDTLIGKGAGGTDLIIISAPEIVVPATQSTINTNIFATLTPNQQAVNMMFCDVPAPTEIPSPVPDGGLTTLYTMRSTPGWNIRPEGITLLSAASA